MNKRERQKAETLADILKVSKELFFTNGYENTSIQQIADRCGMTKGALYHHFQSKDQVLERICRDHYNALLAAARPIAEERTTHWVKRLEEIVRITHEIGMSEQPVANRILTMRNNKDQVHLSQRLAEYDRDFYFDIIGPLLEEGRTAGECSFAGTGGLVAVFIYQLDRTITDEIGRVLMMPVLDNAEQSIRDILDSYIHTLASMLGIEKELVTEVVKIEETMAFFRSVLKGEIDA